MSESFAANPRAIHEIEHCWIPLADGTRLAAKIWLPIDAEEEPVPAILEYLPYRKRDGTRGRDRLNHPPVAEAGYACIRVDIRGTGESESVYHDEYTRQEQQDGCEVIAWIAAQPWCSGAVGMLGISWGGFNGLQIAALRPPALKAIISIGSTDDRYRTDVHYCGGCLIRDNIGWAAVMFSMNAMPPDPDLVGKAWRAQWLDRLEANRPWTIPWMEHQRRDDYWRQGSVCEDFSRIEVPVYAVSGWTDNYSEAVPRLLAGLPGPRKGLIGPWAHWYPNQGVPGPAIGFLQESVRWWDHWLKGIDTGIMNEPMYRVWMQESVPPAATYPERPGRWVTETVWPSPRIATRRLVLNPGSLDDKAGPDVPLDIRSFQTTGLGQATFGHHAEPGNFAMDQRHDDAGSLVFQSQPLAEPMEIMGAAIVALTLEADRPVAMVSVRLNDVAPDGASTRVHHGMLNLNRRNGMERSDPVVPGEPMSVRIELDDVAHVFPPGHRIAVSVSSTCWPMAWPSPEPVTLTVHAGASHLELPVRAPDSADDGLAPFGPAVNGKATPRTPITPGETPAQHRTVTYDTATRRTAVTIVEDAGVERFDDIGVTTSARIELCYAITEDEPLSAEATTRGDERYSREGLAIRVLTRQHLKSDRENFFLTASLEAFENDHLVFERTWNETIPRDGI